MTDAAPLPDTLHEVLVAAHGNLEHVEPAPFSAAAFSLLEQRIGQHIVDLVSESIKVAQRHRADTVSAAHVERASEYLVLGGTRRLLRHLGTLGGVLLGASLSSLLGMGSSGQYSTVGTPVAAGLGIVGAFMIALHIATE